MDNCPSPSQIALYAEGNCSPAEAAALHEHLAGCEECRFALLALCEIQGLEDLNALPLLTEAEVKQARLRFSAKPAHPTKAADGARSSDDRNPEKPSAWEDLLGGAAIASSLQVIHELLDSFRPAPVFAGQEADHPETSLPEDVRNSDSASSISFEHHQTDENHRENHTMDATNDGNNIHSAPTEFGLPSVDGQSPLVQQGYSDTCAVRSQELVLRDFGIPVSEDSLRQTAMEHGWYQPGEGSSQADVGNLLQLYGVDVHKYSDANVFTLTSELAQGHKVIVGVDANELWYNGILTHVQDAAGFQGANHALLVSGIDTSDPDHIKVVVTDPGSGDIAKAYPMEQFVDAWKDSHCFMVSTNDPAPAWNQGMENFNYQTGHLDHVGQMPWADFEHASDLMHDVPADQVDPHVTDQFSHAVHGEADLSSFYQTLTEHAADASAAHVHDYDHPAGAHVDADSGDHHPFDHHGTDLHHQDMAGDHHFDGLSGDHNGIDHHHGLDLDGDDHAPYGHHTGFDGYEDAGPGLGSHDHAGLDDLDHGHLHDSSADDTHHFFDL